MSTQKVATEKVYHLHYLEIDEQLAIFWYVYRDFVKDNVTPEAERPDENLEKSAGLIDQVLANVSRRSTSTPARRDYW